MQAPELMTKGNVTILVFGQSVLVTFKNAEIEALLQKSEVFQTVDRSVADTVVEIQVFQTD